MAEPQRQLQKYDYFRSEHFYSRFGYTRHHVSGKRHRREQEGLLFSRSFTQLSAPLVDFRVSKKENKSLLLLNLWRNKHGLALVKEMRKRIQNKSNNVLISSQELAYSNNPNKGDGVAAVEIGRALSQP